MIQTVQIITAHNEKSRLCVRSVRIPREPISNMSHVNHFCFLSDISCSDLRSESGLVFIRRLIGSRHATTKLINETHMIVDHIVRDQLNHSAMGRLDI